MEKDLIIANQVIPPGSQIAINIPVGKLFDYTDVTIPIRVYRGREEGPTLFVSAALHGDEINGVEAIRRLMGFKGLSDLQGTLILAPIVNVFGFNNSSRYLPDRKDLNRQFPGSKSGSIGSLVAHIFIQEIVNKSTHGIDLHTGSVYRPNLPQIRAALKGPEIERLAKAFGVPVVINSPIISGSMREAATKRKVPVLVYEGGEALRFDEFSIRVAVNGILAVMKELEMFPKGVAAKIKKSTIKAFVAQSSYWVRAPQGGIFRPLKDLGNRVSKFDLLGTVSDPFGKETLEVRARESGLIVGRSNLPLVNKGDAIVHVATFKNVESVMKTVGQFDDIHVGDIINEE